MPLSAGRQSAGWPASAPINQMYPARPEAKVSKFNWRHLLVSMQAVSMNGPLDRSYLANGHINKVNLRVAAGTFALLASLAS